MFIVYLDDILIFSRSWEEHVRQLWQVFDTLRQHRLYMNMENCSFVMTNIKYLGYVIDSVGIHVDPYKVQILKYWPIPKNIHELRIFLGLENFYRRFIIGCSHIACPLNQLTKGNGNFFSNEHRHKNKLLKNSKTSFVLHQYLCYLIFIGSLRLRWMHWTMLSM